MGYVLAGLEPQKCFYYWEEISRIPRGSGNERAVSDYLVRFANERNLEVIQDEALNVLIFKPATTGYEEKKGIIIQGHMDMVCVKDSDSNHNFEKDPLPIYVDGDYIRARGTTLGADNGNALAFGLAILDSDEISHPDLQVIFTTGEEVGLIGAAKLNPGAIRGTYLLNLDSEDAREILLSSAGGSVHTFYTEGPVWDLENANDKVGYQIHIDGLTSGHSGAFAHMGFGNAIKLMGNLLAGLQEVCQFDLLYWHGGLKMNAIAKQAVSGIACLRENEDKVRKTLDHLAACIQKEYQETDPGLVITVEKISLPAHCYRQSAKKKLIDFVDLILDGAYKYMDEEKSMAKTSYNLGVMEETNGKVSILGLMRSNSDYEHEELIRKFSKTAKLVGLEHEMKDKNYAWEYRPDSALVQQISRLFVRHFGAEPKYSMTHGGVEPGILIDLGKQAGKEIQAVSMGVDGGGAHTTKEQLSISSFQKTYEWIIFILKNLD